MVFGWLKRLFKKNRSDAGDAITSVTSSYIDVEKDYIDSHRITSDTSSQSGYSDVTSSLHRPVEKDISLEKTSLELGLAAGYTGRSIHDINAALNRIESLMVTKDWMNANYDHQKLIDLLLAVKSILESHDKLTQEKFDIMLSSMDRISEISEELPEPVKSKMEAEIDAINRISVNLSPKMKKTLEIIKEIGEISYKELTPRIDYKDISSTRSLLSRMRDRTKEIESFEKGNERWVRYIAAVS